MKNIMPVGSFLTLTVFSRTVPYVWGRNVLTHYRKRCGGRVTREDLARAVTVRLVTREKHMGEHEDRRVETIPASYFNPDPWTD